MTSSIGLLALTRRYNRFKSFSLTTNGIVWMPIKNGSLPLLHARSKESSLPRKHLFSSTSITYSDQSLTITPVRTVKCFLSMEETAMRAFLSVVNRSHPHALTLETRLKLRVGRTGQTSSCLDGLHEGRSEQNLPRQPHAEVIFINHLQGLIVELLVDINWDFHGKVLVRGGGTIPLAFGSQIIKSRMKPIVYPEDIQCVY